MTTNDGREDRYYATVLELRDAQVIGQPYRYLEGQAVPYDTWADLGWFMELHAAGSFVQSTKAGTGKGLPLLLFHDNTTFPIGHAESWSHDGGLHGVWRLDVHDERAQLAASKIDAGHLRGLSVGFQPRRSEVDLAEDYQPDLGPDHKDRVTRLESRLLEVSLTPTPAFADAQVALVRSSYQHAGAARPALEAWRAEVNALRSGQH
jgi:HK97 family phage prohead protease